MNLVYNIGYDTKEKYKKTINRKHTKCYTAWKHMLQRCYDKAYKERYPTYISCKVCNKWLNFQNFAKWWENNYYKIEGETMCLDKDILVKRNKIYSPETCVIVPQSINKLFIKNDSVRGNLPVGVVFDKINNKYFSRCYAYNKPVNLGRYNTSEEAFLVYKDFKENLIKDIANKYKKYIPLQLYIAMVNYNVEIID